MMKNIRPDTTTICTSSRSLHKFFWMVLSGIRAQYMPGNLREAKRSRTKALSFKTLSVGVRSSGSDSDRASSRLGSSLSSVQLIPEKG